ncbi:MAG: carboxypeptidase-like regulatory domain-containing protein [bacterium]|nr:carboxypeptidase-like regulatory domain-containing protein [bacterium]
MKNYLLVLFLFAVIPNQYSQAQVKVEGYVIEITTGEPIQNAVVFVNDQYNITKDPSLRDTTNQNGFYTFSVDTGKYHFGVYAPYEIHNDSYMLVYQPGIFSIPDSMLSFFEEHRFRISFGLSRVHFETHLLRSDSDNWVFKDEYLINRLFGQINQLTSSRVTTNAEPFLQYKPISYIEKKTW